MAAERRHRAFPKECRSVKHWTPVLSAAIALSVGFFAAGPATAAPERNNARQIFTEARAICDRDGGRFWNHSLCGPVMLVDWRDRAVIANMADPDGRLVASDDVFIGTLPKNVVIANTPTDWSGARWTQLVVPVTADTAERQVLLAHELFHRIQGDLKLTRPEQANHHLDRLEGRYLLQLEWRALARALSAGAASARSAAISDALHFRAERYRQFPDAAPQEGALEISEGVPEYTGIMLGLRTRSERIAYALRDLKAFVAAPTFVRSFAYATGPAYGLLLDGADPKWRSKLGSGKRLDELLSATVRLPTLSGKELAFRVASYDDGTMRQAEQAREQNRLVRLAGFKAALVEGPVLILPLSNANFQFNPQTLVAMEGVGTIYPTIRLNDDWGSLEVGNGGVLVRQKPHQATVTVRNVDAGHLKGEGWTLRINSGWMIAPGSRAGDLVVQPRSVPSR